MLFYLVVLAALYVGDQSTLFAGQSMKQWLAGKSADWRRTCVMIGMLSSIVLCLVCLLYFHQDDNLNADSRRAYNGLANDLLAHQDRLYVATVSSSFDPWMSPFTDIYPLRKLRMLHTGWSVGSPLSNIMLQRYQAKTPYDTLYQQTNCYLMSDKESAEIVKQYFMEHAGIKVNYIYKYTDAYKIGRGMEKVEFYQFQRVN
jgi:hypothetical protein